MTHAKKQCTYFPCNKRLSLDRDFWQSSPHFLITELLIKYLLGIVLFKTFLWTSVLLFPGFIMFTMVLYKYVSMEKLLLLGMKKMEETICHFLYAIPDMAFLQYPWIYVKDTSIFSIYTTTRAERSKDSFTRQ